jgi:hypothetical protein
VIRDHRASGEVAIITTGDVLDVDAARAGLVALGRLFDADEAGTGLYA